MSPPEQNVLGGQGEHGVPAAALPLYPGLQKHWLIEVLPSAEVEFSGHESGGATSDDLGPFHSPGIDKIQSTAITFALT
jgi:hypothetical protein